MKFLPSQLAYLLSEREPRQDLHALFSFVAVLFLSVSVSTVLFHVIMVYEGQQHSWLTGLYWTLTVMSTLGFGDITFNSDLGRGFTIVVLLYGIVMLLIVAPFMFIRFFYTPWLEKQLRAPAPDKADEGTGRPSSVTLFIGRSRTALPGWGGTCSPQPPDAAADSSCRRSRGGR